MADKQVNYRHNVVDKTGLVVTHDGLKGFCTICHPNMVGQLRDEPATRYDAGKARYDLLPSGALLELTKVYTLGAQKYTDRNWEKGMSYSRIFGAICRHLWKWWQGETLDPETGLHHLAHAAWGCLAGIHYDTWKVGTDDRPKYGETK